MCENGQLARIRLNVRVGLCNTVETRREGLSMEDAWKGMTDSAIGLESFRHGDEYLYFEQSQHSCIFILSILSWVHHKTPYLYHMRKLRYSRYRDRGCGCPAAKASLRHWPTLSRDDRTSLCVEVPVAHRGCASSFRQCAIGCLRQLVHCHL